MEHVCKTCGRSFASGMALGGHQKVHTIPFEALKSDGHRRDRLILENGRYCESCKLAEWLGQPIPLTLDHVDGDSDNNARTNLRILCPNCHAQTPTYCGRNVGKFPLASRRKSRGKYYAPVAQRN